MLSTLAMTPIAIAGPAGVDLSIGPAMTPDKYRDRDGPAGIGLSSPLAVFACAIGLGVLLQVVMGTLIAVLRVSTVVVTLAVYLVLDGMNSVILPQSGGTAPDWLASWGSASTIFSLVLYVPLAAFVLWALVSRTTFFPQYSADGCK